MCFNERMAIRTSKVLRIACRRLLLSGATFLLTGEAPSIQRLRRALKALGVPGSRIAASHTGHRVDLAWTKTRAIFQLRSPGCRKSDARYRSASAAPERLPDRASASLPRPRWRYRSRRHLYADVRHTEIDFLLAMIFPYCERPNAATKELQHSTMQQTRPMTASRPTTPSALRPSMPRSNPSLGRD